MAGFDFQFSVGTRLSSETQLTFCFCSLMSQTTSERCALRNTISPIIEALSFVMFFVSRFILTSSSEHFPDIIAKSLDFPRFLFFCIYGFSKDFNVFYKFRLITKCFRQVQKPSK